mgnify:CR=1 FL=1
MKIEIQNGLRVEINEKNKTATIIKSPKATGNVFIPRDIDYKGEKYIIISIDSYAFTNNSINLLSFPEDSKIQTFKPCTFLYSSIQKLQIPRNLSELEDEWATGIKGLNEIEVSPKNNKFVYQDNKYLLGKSDQDSDKYDILHYVLYDIVKAEIPSQVKIIKTYSLKDHPNLKEIIFPDNSELEIIEDFSICLTPLQKLILPASLHTICSHALTPLCDLVDIQVSLKNKLFSVIDNKYLVKKGDENNSVYDFLLFARRDIESILIPSQIKEISVGAIQYCNKMKSISFELAENLELKIILYWNTIMLKVFLIEN